MCITSNIASCIPACSRYTKQGTWLHLPHNAAEIQQNLEYGSKNILRAAHQQYLQEIAGGANPQQTLDKLVEESYQKLLNYKQ